MVPPNFERGPACQTAMHDPSMDMDYLMQIPKLNPNIWVFPKIGVPQNGWFIMENPIKMDDLGYHHFWKHPYGENSATPKQPKFAVWIPKIPERLNSMDDGNLKRESVLQINCMYTPQVSHWNLRVMVSKFGISYSFWCHFQVNHLKLWEGNLSPAFFVDSWRSSSTSESLEGRTKRFPEGTMCVVFIFSIYIYTCFSRLDRKTSENLPKSCILSRALGWWFVILGMHLSNNLFHKGLLRIQTTNWHQVQ